MTPPQSFALVFGAQFAAFGAMMPFLPAILAEGGLSASEVGAVLAAGSLVRLVAAPLSGRLADAVPDMRRLLAVASLLAAAAALGFGLAAGFALLLAVQVLHSTAAAPIVPLSDALAVGAVRRGGFDYARVRSMGSITFMLGALAAGLAAEWVGPRIAVWMLALGLLLTAWAALRLPAPPGRETGATPSTSIWAPLAEPGFLWVLPLAALIQGSHAVYYGFSTLHWQAAGLSTGFIGLLWALGVLAEIVLFLWGRPVVERLGVRGLALLAAGAGVLRWAVTAVTVEPAVLVVVNLLHGLTFGAMHLSAMRALVSLPAGLSGRAQTLLASAVSASTGGLMWGSGWLYGAVGGLAFLAMAGLCGLAFALALRRFPATPAARPGPAAPRSGTDHPSAA
ncbi:MFS transporter [Sediminicoccus rosea]|uniref:MFS transporter n=1 Tax=Sediminicoccus rosea TaxID=1225128 RepID=A0ABZ0PHJ4_9PROT|nr:MFS transporter [Sediminicoccus rosea]WPB85204.1 MFS transporter [Sediminicoccus rosea]